MPIQTIVKDNDISAFSLRGHIYITTLQKNRGKEKVLTIGEEKELVWYFLKTRLKI